MRDGVGFLFDGGRRSLDEVLSRDGLIRPGELRGWMGGGNGRRVVGIWGISGAGLREGVYRGEGDGAIVVG